MGLIRAARWMGGALADPEVLLQKPAYWLNAIVAVMVAEGRAEQMRRNREAREMAKARK